MTVQLTLEGLENAASSMQQQGILPAHVWIVKVKGCLKHN